MKSLTLTLIVFALSFTFGFAQVGHGLKGPKAKNYKLWKDDTRSYSTLVVCDQSRTNLKGPQYKNYKSWKDEKNCTTAVPVLAMNKKRLKGPKAKNTKPWDRN